MEKHYLSEAEGRKKAHLHLAEALESLDQIEHKTESTKIQMAVFALCGLAFELGFERIVHKSLTPVATSLNNIKDLFIDNDHSVLADALRIAKRRDNQTMSKFLQLQKDEEKRDDLQDFLDTLKPMVHTKTPEEIATELLTYLNKALFKITKENMN
tara:strand:- start:3165 stop:3632 length:468 start_codon:yes stop_codon:yes gene_type:complete